MNFTTERAFSRSLVLDAGIVSRQPSAPLAKLTRRMSRERDLHGHLRPSSASSAEKGLEQLGEIVVSCSRLAQIQTSSIC
jgi:hypothetical protein